MAKRQQPHLTVSTTDVAFWVTGMVTFCAGMLIVICMFCDAVDPR
jgi:hypothetical protein